MLTRRDGLVALAAASMTATVVWAAQVPEEHPLPSAVFDWTKLAVETTPTGERRSFFDSATDSLERFECHATTLNVGQSPHAPHRHVEEELIIVKEGTVEVLQNGTTVQLGPGSVIFHASNDEHGMKNVGEGQATYIVLKWWPPGLLPKKQ